MNININNGVVFSCLYNENIDFLKHLISNFLAFTDNKCILVINLGKHYKYTPEIPIETDRVYFHNGETTREKVGPTLLSGHIENLDFSERHFISFEYFCPIASNSLFFCDFKKNETLEKLHKQKRRNASTINLQSLPEKWHWPKFNNQENALHHLKNNWNIEHLHNNQIEGYLASKKDWQLVKLVHDDLLHTWNELKAPLEEVLPSTVIHTIGSGQTLTIAKVNFGRKESDGGQFVKFNDIFQNTFEQHICIWKWFQRDILNHETFMVCNPVGQAIIKSIKNERATLMELEILQSAIRHNIKNASQNYIENNLIATNLEINSLIYEDSTIANRKKIQLPKNNSSENSFVLLENTNENLFISIRTTTDRLEIACKTENNISKKIQGFIYIPIANSRRVEIKTSDIDRSEENLINQKFIIYDTKKYSKISNIFKYEHKTGTDYVARIDNESGSNWIGIPIISNHECSYFLSARFTN